MRRRRLAGAGTLLLAAALPAGAQRSAPPDAPSRCDSTAPRTPVRVDDDTLFLALERGTGSTVLPEPFAGLVLDELASRVVPPSPLRLDVYADPDSGERLSRDAKLTRAAASAEVRLTFRRRAEGGGTRVEGRVLTRSLNDELDLAVLQAVRALDSAGTALPWPEGARGELVGFLSVGTGSVRLAGSRRPIARLRTPVFALSSAAWPMPGNVGPRYPETMKKAGMTGTVRVDFVVDEEGHAVPGTIRLRAFSTPEFARAVLDVLPRQHFYPSTVGGCPIRTLVTAPYRFELGR